MTIRATARSSGCSSGPGIAARASGAGCWSTSRPQARARGIGLLRLETGIDQVEAIALYESMGFRRCPPFGPYREDPLSPCYERDLA